LRSSGFFGLMASSALISVLFPPVGDHRGLQRMARPRASQFSLLTTVLTDRKGNRAGPVGRDDRRRVPAHLAPRGRGLLSKGVKTAGKTTTNTCWWQQIGSRRRAGRPGALSSSLQQGQVPSTSLRLPSPPTNRARPLRLTRETACGLSTGARRRQAAHAALLFAGRRRGAPSVRRFAAFAEGSPEHVYDTGVAARTMGVPSVREASGPHAPEPYGPMPTGPHGRR
jgi:hypothetical protein